MPRKNKTSKIIILFLAVLAAISTAVAVGLIIYKIKARAKPVSAGISGGINTSEKANIQIIFLKGIKIFEGGNL